MLGTHLLGRVAPPDNKHVALYPFNVKATAVDIEKEIARPTLDVYDQGDTPECVAFSTSKVVNWFNKYAFDAPWLYSECKKIDGMPDADGTNARAACDVLRTIGHWRKVNGQDVAAGPLLKHGIASNHWATTSDQIRAVFATALPQPVLLGIDWYEAWFKPTDKNGEYWLTSISSAGNNVGGHEIGIWACSDKRQAFGLSNTWGSYWPKLVWVSYATVNQLLDQGGDACIITDLATR